MRQQNTPDAMQDSCKQDFFCVFAWRVVLVTISLKVFLAYHILEVCSDKLQLQTCELTLPRQGCDQ